MKEVSRKLVGIRPRRSQGRGYDHLEFNEEVVYDYPPDDDNIIRSIRKVETKILYVSSPDMVRKGMTATEARLFNAFAELFNALEEMESRAYPG